MSCHVIFRLSLNMLILKYFKPKNVLPSPEGLLSCEVPLSSIQAANRSVSTIFELAAGMGTMKGEMKGKQGT